MTLLESAEFRRDRWDRPIVVVNGEDVAYDRPSGLGDCIDNLYNLERYKRRGVLVGLKLAHHLWAQLQATDHETKTPDKDRNKRNRGKLDGIADDAMDVARSRDDRAKLGDALHKMTERIDRGEVLDLPAVFANDMTAYHEALAAKGLRVVEGMIECRIVNDEVMAAGSFDRLLEEIATGDIFVGDVKTGETCDYPHGFAVQLSTYANGELYDPMTDKRTPMPERLRRDKGVIIHLPAGEARCELHFIDLVKGWEAAKVAHWVKRTWQKDRSLLSDVPDVDEAPTRLRSFSELNTDGYVHPDEGAEVADADYTALEAHFHRTLTSDQKLVMTSWVKEGNRAGRHWKLNSNRSRRRFELYRAAIALLQVHDGDEELVRACLRLVLDEEPQGPIGALLGTLTIDQASALERAARATSSAAVLIGQDGVLRWDETSLPPELDEATVTQLFAS